MVHFVWKITFSGIKKYPVLSFKTRRNDLDNSNIVCYNIGMNELQREYVETVAGGPVPPNDAFEFCQGLEQFFQETYVSYDDYTDDGFLKTKTNRFDSFRDAYDFAKNLKSRTKPVLYK